MLRTYKYSSSNQDLSSISVPIRVGLSVDTVGRQGNPKTITAFQTHNTPVLLNCGERAELATDKYIAITPIIEGAVILEENPNYSP